METYDPGNEEMCDNYVTDQQIFVIIAGPEEYDAPEYVQHNEGQSSERRDQKEVMRFPG